MGMWHPSMAPIQPVKFDYYLLMAQLHLFNILIQYLHVFFKTINLKHLFQLFIKLIQI